ncbi:hypothetical protein LSAT2_007536 [Lamellibrachia satsuma]|nr:hypothetical protein LSAT2_007536 [Lamellibrachia satsuma]
MKHSHILTGIGVYLVCLQVSLPRIFASFVVVTAQNSIRTGYGVETFRRRNLLIVLSETGWRCHQSPQYPRSSKWMLIAIVMSLATHTQATKERRMRYMECMHDCINGYTQCLRNVCTRDPDVFRAAINTCRDEETGCLKDCFAEMYDH